MKDISQTFHHEVSLSRNVAINVLGHDNIQ